MIKCVYGNFCKDSYTEIYLQTYTQLSAKSKD